MSFLLSEEESVGPVSTAHSHRYCKKKRFFERAHNFHLIDIFYHSEGCCDEVDL